MKEYLNIIRIENFYRHNNLLKVFEINGCMIPRGITFERVLTGGNHCLLVERIERIMRHVAHGLIIMARVERFHCVALIEVRCTVTFSNLIKSVASSDEFFEWLVLLNAVHMYLRGWDICLISLKL